MTAIASSHLSTSPTPTSLSLSKGLPYAFLACGEKKEGASTSSAKPVEGSARCSWLAGGVA